MSQNPASQKRIIGKYIEKQIKSNQGKNLFFTGSETNLVISGEVICAIQNLHDISEEDFDILIDYSTDRVIREFYRINQYYSIDKQARHNLREIYIRLFAEIRDQPVAADELAKAHQQRLQTWLLETNPFAGEMYAPVGEYLEPVTCACYPPVLQLQVLHLDLKLLSEPVLDIGCGEQGELVDYLTGNGIEAYGIDRLARNHPRLASADWLEYEYGIGKWGTIISHLGFSNHFTHHHFRNDGNFIGYAKKYMEILASLKKGGGFHYAPDLPFIEPYLDPDTYQLKSMSVGSTNFKSVVIERLT